MIEYIQIFDIIKYRNIMNIVHVYLQYYQILFWVNSDKECCPQIFLEECKYAIKDRK